MDQRYEFDGAEVLALLEESRAAKERVMTEAQRYVAAGVDLSAQDAAGFEGEVEHPGTGAPPGLWLMNDHGVYLRSNAARRDADSVAYAASFRTGGRVGDEEMCEFIDAGMLGPLQPGDTLIVTLTERKVRLSLRRPA